MTYLHIHKARRHISLMSNDGCSEGYWRDHLHLGDHWAWVGMGRGGAGGGGGSLGTPFMSFAISISLYCILVAINLN